VKNTLFSVFPSPLTTEAPGKAVHSTTEIAKPYLEESCALEQRKEVGTNLDDTGHRPSDIRQELPSEAPAPERSRFGPD
jgi:hypothetical protein